MIVHQSAPAPTSHSWKPPTFTWVSGLRGIPPQSKAVLWALAEHANSNGLSCYPNLKTIGATAGMSVGNVRYWLRRLEEWDLIVVRRPRVPAPGRSNRYALRLWRTIEAASDALKREVEGLRERAAVKARRAAALVEGTVRSVAWRRPPELREDPAVLREPGRANPLPSHPSHKENSRFNGSEVLVLRGSAVEVVSVAESLATARSHLRALPRRRW